MRVQKFSFGSIRIDGVTYEHDVVIDRGDVRKRKKKPSKKFREQFGHTPVSVEEKIPWQCRRLIIGTGNGRLAGDGPREARGPTSQDRIARPPNQRRHRGAEKASSRNERHPSRDVLTAETAARGQLRVANALVYADRYSAYAAHGSYH